MKYGLSNALICLVVFEKNKQRNGFLEQVKVSERPRIHRDIGKWRCAWDFSCFNQKVITFQIPITHFFFFL